MLAAALLTASTVLAQSSPRPAGGPYVLAKQAIAGGAGQASGGPYVLTGTVAQAAVDPLPAIGGAYQLGAYQLSGGFHTEAIPRSDDLFADGFEDQVTQ